MTVGPRDDIDEIRTSGQGHSSPGWHYLGPAENFRDGKPHAIEAFGTKLVAFAVRNGEVKILDAYCPHMRGDLSYGAVVGDTIDCPIHRWRWDGNGRSAGGSPRPTPTRAWTTHEQDAALYVWHDPEGNPPPADVGPI
ncbi:Rieske 2Fe-2S domain-containing protein [Rhodococcus sp. NPDC059234]|uniref:Rieske 2Fe-2S domain-containing protein n=1 Tax=Rhodococcus sp. NPDC059234 TaxID=3346781 RepID=UPI00366BD071